jgi:hypothetical protein
MRAFRALHPGTLNLLVCVTLEHHFQTDIKGLPITMCPLSALADILENPSPMKSGFIG